ncbi:group II intron reverse transcriptase/maturase [Vibrio splendidus]|uniref:group II intron reverse transcriptase/maturase n=1 Tax=Vibrio splendidus TaxID=29497 RepID=UPI00084C2BA6|nr:group II intron reverse transcriptase/maturase [Vibrio splendidus]OEF77734.1 group II intron reverse transcriptase/maturase [Vibrio splendidus 1F-157]PTP54959.1 group II intron reverse transcriptase/maturase [Vibrio splendidus]
MEAKQFTISKWVVKHAYDLVKANKGSAGVDSQSLADFDRNLKGNLYKIWSRLSSGTYFPPPVKAVSIPKKAGGERILGVPTVSDRIAQMVVRLEFEPKVERIFLRDSYGYRPNKSALDAIGITRQRCWYYNWVLEFDIKGLFDNIPHDLLLKAVYKHTELAWVRLYIERWLVAPMQMEDGELKERVMGTPQGGVISPVLANLFLHYVFDKWLQKHYPKTPWCRYADDGLVHCRSEAEAEHMLEVLKQRFEACGLELHPVKTKIVYCKDGSRKGNAEHISFDFLGYTFKRRLCKNTKRNSMFISFTPAVSKSALKSMRLKIRQLRVRMKTELSIAQIAKWLNPMINGWINYYGRYCRSALYGMCRHLNKALVRWARRKFKPLRRHKMRASKFLEGIAKQCPHLFAHWRRGMVGSFA